NDANGKIIFSEITYTATGEYRYTIQEISGDLGGVTYDDTVYDVTVTVTDNREGQLSAAINYGGEAESAVFNNTYTTTSVKAEITGEKILEGQQLKAGQFEFQLLNEQGHILEAVKNDIDGEFAFPEIEYDEAGDYNYTVREVKGSQGGVTYDEAVFSVTVSVTDDLQGKLVAEVNYTEGPVSFTNTYVPAPDSVVFEAEKTLEGQDLRANQFAFELLDENDDVLQTVKNNQHGQIIFSEVEFEKIGTYSFTIREVDEELGGVTYDQTIYPVTVVVTDDDEGQLHAKVSYEEGPAVFENIYTPASDSIVLEARKILEGQELINNQFTFELLDESDQVIETATTNANGQIIFEELHYESAGKYTYIIRELEGVQGGMTYDDRQYTVVVTVEDNNEGQLIASANYLGGPAVFTNTYTPNPDSVVIEAYKILQGQNLRNGQFSFELVDAEGQVLQSKQNNANGQIIFDEITYDTLGEHAYTIREIKGSQGGVAYDETVFEVHVTVTDDREGNLTAVVEYPEEVEFNNTYVPAPDSVVFEAEKVLAGQDLRADQFDFELINSEGEVLQTKKNNANGQIIFDEITYDTQGEYSYSIREVKGSQGGVSYDGTVFKLAVTVIDNEEGNLIATVDYKTEQVVFTNSYAAAPTTATLVANKILEGKDLKNKQFSFELLDGDNKVLLTASNMADGSVKFPAIDYDQAGEYKYTIREVKANEPGYIYDDSEFEVIVTVTDDGEGKLHAKVVYTDGELPEFTNEFSQELLDSLYPEPPKTGESRSSSLLGLALIVAGLAVVVYAWQNQRPRKRYRGQ
ncbi:MAG: hypothetical protein GX763_03655, partial [Clostridiaceae bacterium]|nr:hypothetical protein [Clostridiaceae bacterium]